jgi:Zn-dependent protease with chaperone function
MKTKQGTAGRLIRSALICLTISASTAFAASSTCIRIGNEIPTVFRTVWNVEPRQIAELLEAHRKLSSITGLRPELLVCGTKDINAVAFDTTPQRIEVNTGLLKATNSEDELAAVLGHEFAHLKLHHLELKHEQVKTAVQQAVRVWSTEVARGVDSRRAKVDGVRTLLESTSSFSRTAEREADDMGVKLATTAGYAPGGARAFALRLIAMGLPPNEGYLASHQGLGERAWYGGRLAANEVFRKKAEAALSAGNGEELARTVAEWKAQAPDSSGAAYYAAFAALMLKRPPGDVAAQLEDAVLYFGFDRQSIMGEEYATELVDAEVALCVSLYRERRIYPALNCIKRLPRSAQEEFRSISGWNGFLVLGRAPDWDVTSVFGARDRSSGVILSTCPSFATEEGLRTVVPWAGLRPAKVSAESQRGAVPMQCDPTMCDCSPVSLKGVVVRE